MFTRLPVRRQQIQPFTLHQDLAGIRILESSNDAQQRRLSRAALSENGQKLSLGDLQRDVAEYGVLAKRLRNIADVQQWIARRTCQREQSRVR